jgi:hypothetical protein
MLKAASSGLIGSNELTYRNTILILVPLCTLIVDLSSDI